MSEDMWRDRANTAEAQANVLRNNIEAANQRVNDIKKAFGIKEKYGGRYVIDYEALVAGLGPEGAAELRKIIDDRYGPASPGKESDEAPGTLAHLAGKTVTILAAGPGQKPKLRIHA